MVKVALMLVIKSNFMNTFGYGIVTNLSRSSSYEFSASSKITFMPALCAGRLSALGSSAD